MSTLFAKNGFSRPSLVVLRGLQTRAIPAGQGRLRQLLHRTKKIGLYIRGVNGPPLQTTIIIVKASLSTVAKHHISVAEINIAVYNFCVKNNILPVGREIVVPTFEKRVFFLKYRQVIANICIIFWISAPNYTKKLLQ